MSRVPLVEYADASAAVRALYEANGDPEHQRNVTKMVANQPDFLAGFMAFVKGLYHENELAPRLRELTYLRASQINQCHY